MPSWSHLLAFLGLLLFFFLTKFSRSLFCNCSARAKLFKKKTPTCPACRTNCIQDNISMRPANDYSQTQQMPTTINLDSSGLSHATTITNQSAHLRLASPRSFSSARVPFSTIHSNLKTGLTSWVQSLAVKVQVSSTLKVSRHVFTLLPFEPITSTTKISSAKTALKATAEMQPSADSNNIYNASSFDDKPSSTFQLVVASVSWISKAISNKPFKTLRLEKIKSKMQPIFQLIVGFKANANLKITNGIIFDKDVSHQVNVAMKHGINHNGNKTLQ